MPRGFAQVASGMIRGTDDEFGVRIEGMLFA